MEDMFATNFGAVDWVIVALYLTGIATVGVVLNRYIHNAADYIVGGRSSGPALNAASYIGTSLGLVTIMYSAIEGFRRGFTYLTIAVIWLVITFIIGKSGFVIHRLRARNLITIPEYFEDRFNTKIRIVSGALCALAGILNMGLFPRMGATFITYATGLGHSPVVVNLVTSAMIVLVLIYTVMGGMVSVLVCDYIQFVVLSIGIGFGLYICFTDPVLGWGNMVSALVQHRGEAAFNPVHPDSYGWVYMLWMVVVGIAGCTLWAPEASRALTAKDATSARRTFLIASPGLFFRVAAPTIWAIAAFCYFQQHPQLSEFFFPDGPSGQLQHAPGAMPLFIGKVVPTVLLGFLSAGLMAAFMSTHDSYLLCWSSVITRDVISPLRKSRLTDRQQIRITRISLVSIGVFLLVWGIWYKLPESVWTYMAVTGNIYLSGSAAALIGGMYWRRGSSAGAMAAILCGLLSIWGIFLGPIQKVFPWLTAEILGIGNYGLCVAAFVVFSLLFPDKQKSDVKEA